jgi:hypothetical protein
VKQSIAPGVKSASLQVADGGTLQFRFNAGLHLRGGILGVRERNNFAGAGVPFANEVGDALREDGCFSRASSRDHQHRTMDVFDGLLLALIGNDLRRR